MSHFDFQPGSGPCFSALHPGDTFRFLRTDWSPLKDDPMRSQRVSYITFHRNVIYVVIARMPAVTKEYIGVFVTMDEKGSIKETLV